nr:hypothetical protein [Acinetobacter sp. ACNIH1]
MSPKFKPKETSMPHMTHNYMLGLAALLISFGITFYLPIAYFWLKVRQQRNQNK